MIDAFDSLLIAILEWLNATNISYPEFTVFAAEMSIELLYSSECMESEPSEQCFSVLLRYNGKPLEFEGICSDPALCTYSEFSDYIDSIWYNGEHADDLNKACNASILTGKDTYYTFLTPKIS